MGEDGPIIKSSLMVQTKELTGTVNFRDTQCIGFAV